MKFISESKVTSSVIPTAVSSAHAALLRQINRTERFQVFAKNQLNKNSKIETFLSLLFESTTKIIRNYRPEQSIAIIYLQCEVYFRFTERIRLVFKWSAQFQSSLLIGRERHLVESLLKTLKANLFSQKCSILSTDDCFNNLEVFVLVLWQ